MESPFAPTRTLDIPPELERADSNDIKHIEQLNTWRSCCWGKTDSRLIKFLAQYLILLMVFVFTLFQLHYANSCEDSTAYLSLLTLLLGVVIPSPK
jgi:hypothetical protein